MDTTEHWKRKTRVFIRKYVFLERLTKGSRGIETHWKDCVWLLVALATGTEPDEWGNRGCGWGEALAGFTPGGPIPPNSPSQRNQDGGSPLALTYTNWRNKQGDEISPLRPGRRRRRTPRFEQRGWGTKLNASTVLLLNLVKQALGGPHFRGSICWFTDAFSGTHCLITTKAKTK